MKPHEKDRNRLRGGSASAVAAVSAHGSQSKGRLLDEAVRSELVVTHNASRRINFVQARCVRTHLYARCWAPPRVRGLCIQLRPFLLFAGARSRVVQP
jgi:hypothetical protein